MTGSASGIPKNVIDIATWPAVPPHTHGVKRMRANASMFRRSDASVPAPPSA
jgi:hypothetical protein